MAATATARSAAIRSKDLSLYFKSYKGGADRDWHLGLFLAVRAICDAVRNAAVAPAPPPLKVLYPGCHRHITASLAFPNVTYVDCDKKVAPLYSDAAALAWVDAEKRYPDPAEVSFVCATYDGLGRHLDDGSFDLLISLSAGLVTPACTRFVAPGGFLLVNDGHADARTAFLSPAWCLAAVWVDGEFDTSPETLGRCFRVKAKTRRRKGKAATAAAVDGAGELPLISAAQVDESVAQGSVSKRSFTMPFEPLIYMFRRAAEGEVGNHESDADLPPATSTAGGGGGAGSGSGGGGRERGRKRAATAASHDCDDDGSPDSAEPSLKRPKRE